MLVQRFLHVFYQNHYIGLFYLESVEFRRYSRTELSLFIHQLKCFLKKLNVINPDLFPNSSITKEMEQELFGMMAKCYHFSLVPVDENFLRRWEWKNMEESNPWSVIILSDDDITVPKRFEDKEKNKKLISLEESCEITDCFSLMKYSDDKFCFLNDVAKEAFILNVGTEGEETEDSTICNDDADISFPDNSILPQENDLPFTMEDILNGAIHVSAVNMAKACDENVVNVEHSSIIPARNIINAFTGDNTSDPEKYQAGLLKTGLKPILTRPTHPHIISSDPIASLAYCSIKHHTNNTLGKREKQWVVVFTCIFCSVVNPPALLQLHRKWKGGDGTCQNAVAPSPNDLDDVLKIIGSMKWEGKFIHPIYRKVYISKKDFVRFLKDLKSRGEDIFEKLIGQHDGNRSNSLNSLRQEFGIFSPFQIHAFMRIIETCIFEPFGVVNKVPSAYGGICGARCFIQVYKKLNPTDAKIKSDKEILEQIPSWIVTWYNREVKTKIETGTENIKQQTEDELLVLQLCWSIEYECLVNTQGINKKFDSSDAEHMLCMFYCLVVNTLPSRNMGKTMTPPKLDSEKYHPIYQVVDDTQMKLSFMDEQNEACHQVMETYQKMLKCEQYPHHRLRDKFRIDQN